MLTFLSCFPNFAQKNVDTKNIAPAGGKVLNVFSILITALFLAKNGAIK
jgi:hypothetical protein